MPRPLSVLIKPASSRCNLSCTYCFYLEKQSLYPWSAHPAMTLDTFCTFLHQYARVSAPVLSFAWQGGEPTMMGLPWFQEVVRAQQRVASAQAVLAPNAPWRLSNALQTNGTLLDEAWAEFFRDHHFLVGLSLDGPAEWHDRYRIDRHGHGQHEKVLQALDLLRRFRVEFNVLCVVSAANVHHPRELLRYYRRLGIEYLQFIPCVEPAGGHDSGAAQPGAFSEYSITPEEYGHFLNELFDAWMETGFRKVRIRYFDNLLQVLITGQPQLCQLAPSCGYIVLEHNGDCYPCDFFVERRWKLGNIHETTLEEMLRSERFRRFAAMKPSLHPACQTCQWKALCYGECPRYRIINSGAAEGQLPYFCEAYRQFFARSYRRLERTAAIVARELVSPRISPAATPPAHHARRPPADQDFP